MRRLPCLRVVALLPLLALSRPLDSVAQERRGAAPGAVVTVPLRVPAAVAGSPDLARSVEFEIRPRGGVDLVGSDRGTMAWEAREEPVLPVSIRLPRRAAAGPLSAARVVVRAGGVEDTLEVELEVSAVRGLTARLASDRGGVEPGEAFGLEFTVVNSGNVPDSFRLEVASGSGSVEVGGSASGALDPFGEARGRVGLRAPDSAPPGGLLPVRVRIAGQADTIVASTLVRVEAAGPSSGTRSSLAGSVFLGGTVRGRARGLEGEPVLVGEGGAELPGGVDLLYEFRTGSEDLSAFAFRGLLGGPRLRGSLVARDWEIHAGDVDARTSDILGYYRQGRGVDAVVRPGPIRIALTAARPQSTDGRTVAGHVGAAEVTVREGPASGGVLVSTERWSDPARSRRSDVSSALLRTEVAGSGHHAQVDFGAMRIADLETGAAESGPALSGRYTFRSTGTNIDLLARARPPGVADPTLPPSEVRALVSRALGRGLTAYGSAWTQSVPARGIGTETSLISARGGRASLQFGRDGWTLDASANVQTARGRAVDRSRSTVGLDLSRRVGGLHLFASGTLGPARENGVESTYRLIRAGAGMYRPGLHVSSSLTYASEGGRDGYLLLDGVASLATGTRSELDLALTAYRPAAGGAGTVTAKIAGSYRFGSSLRAYAGLENRFRAPWTGGDWNLSVGIRKGLGVPLPFRRDGSIRGTVFADLNANGRMDPGEAPLAGVAVRLDGRRSLTGSDGRFELPGARTATLGVEPGSIGPGFVIPPDRLVDPGETLWIAVVPTGRLEVLVFLDLDGDGAPGADERPLAGVGIEVRGRGGEFRVRTGEDGLAALAAIPVGPWVLRVDRGDLPRRAGVPEVTRISVEPGDTSIGAIAVPVRPVSMPLFDLDD